MAKNEKTHHCLFICGKCGCDVRTRPMTRTIHKVVLSNRANMLCTFCKQELEIAIENLAEEYLSKAQKPAEKP